MSKKFMRLAVSILSSCVISMPLVACSERLSLPYMKPAGWETMCLDRLLMDLPMDYDVGAAAKGYKKGIGYDGIEDVGWQGVRWSALRIDETFVGTPDDFEKITRKGASVALSFISSSKSGLKSSFPEMRRFYEARLKSSDQELAASAHTALEDLRSEQAKTLRNIAVSGKAPMPNALAAAIRFRDDFVITFFDETDKRIRIFEGPLKHPELDISAATKEYERLRSIYHRRAPHEIPTGPGYCTGYGFIDEPAGKPEWDTQFELPIRSLKYPNLIITLNITPREATSKPAGDIQSADNPNEIKVEDVRNMTGMGALGALASLGTIKKRFGPEYLDIGGQKGRIIGREYKPGSDMGAAYEFEAEVLGVPGQIDKPAMRITMAAALPDEEPLPRGAEPRRPALKGHQPPPFDEGLAYFRQVLQSIRPRPVVVAAPR